ncbi:MAG: hypothetical protein AMS22_06365 [Thiotrichales bacterium SG8_50]|nr:MAG: hypothetical protein AMS22_06365 [Thiotrichales bacterium SG8_50]
MTLFDKTGELTDERALDRCDELGNQVQNQLECLLDSGVSPVEVQAYAALLVGEVMAACDTATFNHAMGEGSNNEELDSEVCGNPAE